MEEELRHGNRTFVLMAFDDAVHDDARAVELSELVDGELGPGLVTVLFPFEDASAEVRVLLDAADLPLPVLRAFMARIDSEERRLRPS